MRIGIDARELLGERTGVGRYLADLCTEWRRLPAEAPHHFTLYAHVEGSTPALLGPPFDQPSPRFSYRTVPGQGATWWEQTALASAVADDRPDVLFAPAYSAPLRSTAPVVLTVHDISFETHPEWFGWREGLRRRWSTRQAVQRASRVIAVSGFTRDELVDHFRVPAARIAVVWSGVHHPARVTADREPLVLFVGTLFNRRHIPELVTAFRTVASQVPAARLVLVGANRTHPVQDPARLAEAAGISDRVEIRHYVDEAELASLYARARVFVFLSEYEGFGLPPLEAMVAGIPTVVGDTPVARELYADAAWRVDPGDPSEIAIAIATLLEQQPVRARYLETAASRLPRFTWARAARETLRVLEDAARP